jgi:hypothetical protein
MATIRSGCNLSSCRNFVARMSAAKFRGLHAFSFRPKPVKLIDPFQITGVEGPALAPYGVWWAYVTQHCWRSTACAAGT